MGLKNAQNFIFPPVISDKYFTYTILYIPSDLLSMLKRLKSDIAVFVFKQSDCIFLCVSAIHARRTTCKDYVMVCLSILYKTSLIMSMLLLGGLLDVNHLMLSIAHWSGASAVTV